MMQGANSSKQMLGPMAKEVIISGGGVMVSTGRASDLGETAGRPSNDYNSIMVRTKDVAQTKEISKELQKGL